MHAFERPDPQNKTRDPETGGREGGRGGTERGGRGVTERDGRGGTERGGRVDASSYLCDLIHSAADLVTIKYRLSTPLPHYPDVQDKSSENGLNGRSITGNNDLHVQGEQGRPLLACHGGATRIPLSCIPVRRLPER